MRRFTFLLAIFYSISVFPARYLLDAGSGNTWTDPSSSGGTRVNLSTAGAGGISTDFAAWFNNTTMSSGDEVWITGGTYVVAAAIALKDGVNIYGGFAGNETAVSGRSKGTNAWDFTNVTEIDFNNISPGTTGLNCAAAFVNTTVIDGLSVTKIAKLLTTGNGCFGSIIGTVTIQNCKFYNNTFTRSSGTTTVSGGIFVRTGASVLNSYFNNNQSLGGTGVRGGAISSAGAVTVKGCLFENNSATGNGGAISIASNTASHSSGGTFEDCIIRNNTAGSGGGGIYHNTTQNKTGDVLIKNCQITDNTATSGGAIEINGSASMTISLSIEGCTIARNTSTTTVGAVNLSATPATTVNYVKNCIFRDNKNSTSGQEGAALYSGKGTPVYNCVFANNTGNSSVYVSATSKVYNCTFANNAAIALKLAGATCEAKNNIFWNNADNTITGGATPTLDFNAYSGSTGADAGTNSISSLTVLPNNTFVSPSTFSGAAATESQKTESNNANWALLTGCPAINAGTDLAPTITTDILGNSRPNGVGAVDMGAFESSISTDTEHLIRSGINIKTISNGVLVSGIKSGSMLSVYTVTGTLIEKKPVMDEVYIALQRGLYIIHVQNNSYKVIVH